MNQYWVQIPTHWPCPSIEFSLIINIIKSIKLDIFYVPQTLLMDLAHFDMDLSHFETTTGLSMFCNYQNAF